MSCSPLLHHGHSHLLFPEVGPDLFLLSTDSESEVVGGGARHNWPSPSLLDVLVPTWEKGLTVVLLYFQTGVEYPFPPPLETLGLVSGSQ